MEQEQGEAGAARSRWTGSAKAGDEVRIQKSCPIPSTHCPALSGSEDIKAALPLPSEGPGLSKLKNRSQTPLPQSLAQGPLRQGPD